MEHTSLVYRRDRAASIPIPAALIVETITFDGIKTIIRFSVVSWLNSVLMMPQLTEPDADPLILVFQSIRTWKTREPIGLDAQPVKDAA